MGASGHVGSPAGGTELNDSGLADASLDRDFGAGPH